MSVLALDDAAQYLRVAGSADDDELQATIDAAEALIAQRVGPVSATAVTRRLSSANGALSLPVLPAISLTSVTPMVGAALTLSDLYLDTSNGIVTHSDGVTAFFGSGYYYTVVYQAGWSTLPADLLLAIKELVRHMWATQRGSGVSRPGPNAPEMLSNTLPGAAHTLPIRVEQLLAPYQQFGFA